MPAADQVKTLVLKFWKSWQKPDWQEMRECLDDEIEFGGNRKSADAFTEMCKTCDVTGVPALQ